MSIPASASPYVSRRSGEAASPKGLAEDALRQMMKAFRARQLYLQNNPMAQRSVDAMRASFASLWSQVPSLVLAVTETDLLWEEQSVLSEPDKASDSIPWLCHKDGIRELTLEPGFELTEAEDLFSILQRVRKATPDDDDLVAMLWERDFSHLHYRHLELSASGTALPVASAEQPTQLRVRPDLASSAEPATASIVNVDDFDSTLHFLEPREIEYLQNAIAREYADDLRRNIITILLDMFELQRDVRVRAEILTNLDEFLVRLFASGALATVAYLLRESIETVGRGTGLTPEQRERLDSLPERLSTPEVLSQLLQTLDEMPELPPKDEMDLLFDALGVRALETIFEWIGRAEREQLRGFLTQAADRLASSNSAELVRLIESTTLGVSGQAIRRAGALRTPAAVSALSKVLTAESDAALRLASVQALASIASPAALQAVERAIGDADRDVRLASLRAIAARAYRPAFERLQQIVKAGDARGVDLTEKMALFEAYGAVCGADGLDLLDRMLNKRGLLRREDPEVRACAAVALGRLGTQAAIEALRRAANDKDAVVRNAVGRAMRSAEA